MSRNGIRNNNERVTNEDTRRKMAEGMEFGPRKTIIVLAIVAGCFAVLWPKIFYPMINPSAATMDTPADGPACCDLIFENDVNAVDIMQEMCKNILRHHQVDPRVRDVLRSTKLTPQSASLCREEVLARCGIDLSSFLAEREKLGKTYKQVLEEIRSFNSSLCLKRQFGVPLSRLGTPHLIRYHILMPHSPMRQERRVPPHAGGLHPALQQRGRAIPSSHIVPKVDGRPDHVVMEKMRPPLGAAGRVVATPSGNSSMGIIMPLYTLGIFLFFLYTIAKVMRKNSDNEIYADYQNPAAEREFRNKVFSPELLTSAITGVPCYRKDRSQSPKRPIPTIEELKEQAAGDIEIDQLRQRLVDTEAAMERIVVQMGSLSRSVVHSPQQDTQLQDECVSRSCCSRSQNGVEEVDESAATVKVMGMEMTACCEGGQRISRPTTPIIPQHSHMEREMTPPKPIYLEGALPPQCELLVADSETQAENSEDDVEAPVVLSGKMTLSLISHDQNQAESDDESLDLDDNCKRVEEISTSVEMDHESKTIPALPKGIREAPKVELDSEEDVESEMEDEEDDEDEDEVEDLSEDEDTGEIEDDDDDNEDIDDEQDESEDVEQNTGKDTGEKEEDDEDGEEEEEEEDEDEDGDEDDEEEDEDEDDDEHEDEDDEEDVSEEDDVSAAEGPKQTS